MLEKTCVGPDPADGSMEDVTHLPRWICRRSHQHESGGREL